MQPGQGQSQTVNIRQGADWRLSERRSPLTLCDGHRNFFVTISGQILILMAAYICPGT
jgi:hypothetical protein